MRRLLLLASLVCCCRGGRRSAASAVTSPSQHRASSPRRVADVSRVGPAASSGPLTARGGAARPPGWASAVLAGGVSRSLAQALLYPVDALRTLAQTRDGRTLADVGVRSLVRGCAQTSSFALFTGGIQFGIFGAVNPRLGPLAASVAGAAGSCLVSVPQEVIKQRLITGIYGSFREAFCEIYRTEGVRGFYSAWKPTVSRNVPFVITTFTTRDVIRERLVRFKRRRGGRDGGDGATALSPAENVGVGITSALVAGLVTQPIDVVKTRLMTQAASSQVPYKSAFDCAASIVRTEGWTRLYSGLRQRSVYMCGLWGITFGVEPLLREYIEKAAADR